MDVKGKVVFVSGSSIGIGREIAKAFANEKASPIITYHKDKEEAEKVMQYCSEITDKVSVKKLNLMDDKSIKNVVKEVVKEYGNIDILVNNAGVIYWKELRQTSYEEIEEQIRVNLEGLIKLTKETIHNSNPKMIINIASGAGKTGYATLSTYCATKFEVRGFSYALSKELDNVKIRIINPRSTKTRMTGFKGDEPEEVAKIVLKVAKEEIKDFEVDIWSYL